MYSRDFRFLWASTFFASIGFVGEVVVVGWLVLERTGSPFMVGVALAVGAAPMFFLGTLAGAIADSFDRRVFIRLVNAGLAVATAFLGLLLVLELAPLGTVLAMVFASGALRALALTTRQSFAYDIVGPSGAVGGLAFIALAMRLGGLVGSLMAGGATTHWGAGIAFLVLAASYVVAVAVLLPIRSRGQAAPELGQSLSESLKEYGREIRRNHVLRMLSILTAAVEVLGFSHQALLPSIVRDVLHMDAFGLGVVNAFRSVGGVLGIGLLAAFGGRQRRGLLLLAVLLVFGLSIVALGLANTLVMVLLIIIAINVTSVMSDVLLQTLMQLNVPNELRGRAMGSWVLAVGLGPLGLLQIGALAAVASVGLALGVNGLGLIALTGAAFGAARLRRL